MPLVWAGWFCYNFDALMLSGFLTENELKWLSRFDTIRVGYQDDYMPFCVFQRADEDLQRHR